MSSGDVVYQITNVRVQSDNSERTQSPPNERSREETSFNGGTTLIPSGAGVGLAEPIALVLGRPITNGGTLPETLFDSTKYYKITIEEV